MTLRGPDARWPGPSRGPAGRVAARAAAARPAPRRSRRARRGANPRPAPDRRAGRRKGRPGPARPATPRTPAQPASSPAHAFLAEVDYDSRRLTGADGDTLLDRRVVRVLDRDDVIARRHGDGAQGTVGNAVSVYRDLAPRNGKDTQPPLLHDRRRGGRMAQWHR